MTKFTESKIVMLHMLEKLMRWVGPFKGKHRLARVLFVKKLAKARDVQVSGKWGCTYLLPNLTENIGFDVFINGVYEENHLNLIIRNLPANTYFLDIGANIGTIAIPVCKKRPDVTGVCIEASTVMFDYLKKNVQLNELNNIQLLQRAVSDTDGLEVSFYNPDEKYGKGSLGQAYTTHSEKVTTITIDAWLAEHDQKKVGLMKIDVEGFECGVFKGAERLLNSSDAPDILFEFVEWAERHTGVYQSGEAQRFLLSLGYKLYLLEGDNLLPLKKEKDKGFGMLYATKK